MPARANLVHLDIKKLGRIPQGGGKRILPGFGETHSGPQRGPRLGFDFLHVAVDDHSRYAYVEALPDERGATAAAFLVRALAHFKRQDIAVERILTDNGACYVSRIFTRTAAARNIRVKRTRPFRPQTNGKAEAFNKIMQAEWAYQRPYYSNRERLNALPGFLAYYNHRRPHGGIDGATPASRLSTTSLETTPSRLLKNSEVYSGLKAARRKAPTHLSVLHQSLQDKSMICLMSLGCLTLHPPHLYASTFFISLLEGAGAAGRLAPTPRTAPSPLLQPPLRRGRDSRRR